MLTIKSTKPLPIGTTPTQALLVSYLQQPDHLEKLQSLAQFRWSDAERHPANTDLTQLKDFSRPVFDAVFKRVGRNWSLSPRNLFSGLTAVKPKDIHTPETARAANKKNAVIKFSASPLAGLVSGLVLAAGLGLPAGLAVVSALTISALVYRTFNGGKLWRKSLENFITRSPDYVTNPWGTYLSGRQHVVVHNTGSPAIVKAGIASALLEDVQTHATSSQKPRWQNLPLARAVVWSILKQEFATQPQPAVVEENAFVLNQFINPFGRVAAAMQAGALATYSPELPQQSAIIGDQVTLSAADLGLAVLAVAEEELGPKIFRQILKGDYSFLIPQR